MGWGWVAGHAQPIKSGRREGKMFFEGWGIVRPKGGGGGGCCGG